MLRKTVVARALSIAFSTAVLSAAVVAPVMAQSNASGNIYGQVDAPAGASIQMTNTDNGLKRSTSVEPNGRYLVTALPIGHYRVELLRNGAVAKTVEVDVIAGQGVDASFSAAELQRVQVSGRRNKIDVSNTNNSTTFTAKELATLPIAKSVDAIIQLAPNTTRADSRYSGGASFGGGGASENAYYINGFPVTNPLSQLGGAELPFGAIAQADIITGGFGAEFGRSVGGVVNITSKSGSNNWEFGLSGSVTPKTLRARPRDLTYANTGSNPATDNMLRLRNEDNTNDGKTYGGYVGGPLIKDKLFLFIAAENLNNNTQGVNLTTAASAAAVSTSGWIAQQQQIRRHLEKLDWNITDSHRIELTQLGDNTARDVQLMGYNYATRAINRTVSSSQHYYDVGGNSIDLKMGRYVGNLTEDLTLTVLYGTSKSPHRNTYDGYNPTAKLYQISQVGQGFAPGLNYATPQVLTGNILPVGAEDQIKSTRVDLEYKLGQHTIRAGLDDNKLSSLNAGEMTAGGGVWSYRVANPATTLTLNGEKVQVGAGAAPGSLASKGYYVREGIFNDATNTYSNQKAQYIEDRFQATKNLLLIGGLRVEEMENLNGDKQTFLKVKNQLAPRLSASWDVNGDGSTKVFGSAGRYSVQIPTHISVRGASRSLNTTQYFTYTGTDANGNPTGLKPLTSKPFSSNNEYYQPKDPLTVVAQDIKPTYQDEITLGFEKALTPSFNFGAKATYRKLRQTIDDYCDERPFDAWAARNKVDTSNWRGFGCASFNPGEDNSFLVDFNDANPALAGKTHTLVKITAAEFGFEKVQRDYKALDLFVEHPYRNGWYGRVNYTLSRSYGNTEGQTLSDVAQTDVAATQAWDYKEIMDYAKGLLPNDRLHQIKAYGFYDITPEWTIGGNGLVASGRPINCLGDDPNLPADAPDYGSTHHYCNGKPSPRGTMGRLPWDIRLDANLMYKPVAVKGLSLKVDVFNVFNKQTAQTIDEIRETGAHDNTVIATYGRILSYTPARSVRFTAEYNYRF